MLYYKNQLKLILVLLCLVILDRLTSVSYAKEDIIDMGETGFTAQVQVRETAKDYLVKNISGNSLNSMPLRYPNLFYRTSLPKHEGSPVIRHVSFKKNSGLPIGTRVFVFSLYDEDSIRAASVVGFDYGLCIEYKSMDDIKEFKKELKLNQPIAMSNDETVKTFGVSAYPTLITVHDNEFEIQEGF